MQSILEPLGLNVERVRAERALYDVLTDALAAKFADDPKSLREYDRRARRSTYSTIVVGCYGLIEQTVDALLTQLAVSYGGIYDAYSSLPDVVRSEHRTLLLQCLKDGDRARIRGRVEDADALEALGRQPGGTSRLVAEAFTLSTANYRFPYTQSLFSRLSVNVERGLSADAPVAALNQAGFANYESFLEDLVQRRNDLAHSYADDDLVDPALLDAYVEIVAGYLRSLVRVVRQDILVRLADRKLVALGEVVKAWTGRIGIQMAAGEIAVGDRLLLVKEEWCTSHDVVSLQRDGQTAEHFAFGGESMSVAAKIDVVPGGAEGAKAFVIPQVWKEYWPETSKSF